jgi:hypothetical protein
MGCTGAVGREGTRSGAIDATRYASARVVLVVLGAVSIAGCHGLDAREPDEDRADGREALEQSIEHQARALIEQERFEEASSLLQSAMPTNDTGLVATYLECDREAHAKVALSTACIETDAHDVEAVYEQCWRIPEASRYYKRGCCADAGARFGELELSRSTLLLGQHKVRQALIAAEVLAADTQMPDEIRDRAGGIASRAKRQLKAGPRVPEEDAFEAAKAHVLANEQLACIDDLVEAPPSVRNSRLLVSCYLVAGKSR